jgi:DNA-binding response OmpR family regulator
VYPVSVAPKSRLSQTGSVWEQVDTQGSPQSSGDQKLAVEVAAQIGDARLVAATRVLDGPRGQEKLTERETRLVMTLCRSEGLVSRPLVYRSLFQRDWDPFDRSLDVHMSNLRRKLKAVSKEPAIIANRRGENYELRGFPRIEISNPL